MTHLRERTVVNCPIDEAEARLSAYLESLRDAGGTARVRLRVRVRGSSAALGLSLDREVRVEATRARDEQGLKDVTRIAWRPEGKAVFPPFEGTLAVRAGEDGKTSRIELDGEYLPPFGAAGQIFNEMIGRRLAASTARELLADVKRAIESPPPPSK